MGITFRNGNYIKFVRFGGRTIKDGEAAAIWNRNGVHTEIVGPRRVQLFFSTIRFLSRFKAESNQYLVVKHINGRVEHLRGPTALFQNPAIHDEVLVVDGVHLKSSSEFVLIQNDPATKESVKKVSGEFQNLSPNIFSIQGPALFIPSPSEYVHRFSWSRIDGERLVPGDEGVEKFRTSANHLDATITVPLSNSYFIKAEIHVEYKISNLSLGKLLEHEDPISRMFNSLRVDGLALGGNITLDMIRNWNQGEMNSIFNNVENYPELCGVAEQSGIEILEVSLSGQSLSDRLRALLDAEHAISNELQSEIKAKEKRQELRVLEQEERMKEVENDIELSRKKLQNDDMLEREMHAMKKASWERANNLVLLEAMAINERNRMKDENMLLFLEKIKQMDVDMTKFLSSTRTSVQSQVQKRVKGVDDISDFEG